MHFGNPVTTRLAIMPIALSQVDKVGQDEVHDEKRLVLTADFNGRVLEVEQPDSELFEFRGGDLVGCSLCDTVDIFNDVSFLRLGACVEGRRELQRHGVGLHVRTCVNRCDSCFPRLSPYGTQSTRACRALPRLTLPAVARAQWR